MRSVELFGAIIGDPENYIGVELALTKGSAIDLYRIVGIVNNDKPYIKMQSCGALGHYYMNDFDILFDSGRCL